MITATGMGQIAYNGQGGNDSLTVASPAATTVTLTPGAAVDSGTVQMGTAATLVPLSYSNLGTTGTLTVANTGGTRVDTLVYDARPATTCLLSSRLGVRVRYFSTTKSMC